MKYLVIAFIAIIGLVMLTRGRVMVYFPFSLLEVLGTMLVLIILGILFFRK